MRCVNSEFLFHERSDFQLLHDVIAHYKKKYAFKLYAYIFMNSHFHLCIRTPENDHDTISKIMQGIAWRFAFTYNRRRVRKGHFFSERFKSPLVENDTYGLQLLKYIHQNPVRAGIVNKPAEWEYSSYSVYSDGADDDLVDLMPTFLGIAASRKRASANFREFVEGVLEPATPFWTKATVIGSPEFMSRFGTTAPNKYG